MNQLFIVKDGLKLLCKKVSVGYESVWTCAICTKILGTDQRIRRVWFCPDCGAQLLVEVIPDPWTAPKWYSPPRYRPGSDPDQEPPQFLVNTWISTRGEIPIAQLETKHLGNILRMIATKKIAHDNFLLVHNLLKEFESRSDVQQHDVDAYLLCQAELEKEYNMTKVYNIRIQSPFILTTGQVKSKLGIGFQVLSCETETDLPQATITDVDSAVEAIVKVGYRSLARAYHPDLGGEPEKMQTLNRAKKELLDLLASLK